MSGVPGLRIRLVNREPVQRDGRYVLYWMTAARRTTWNFGLERAVERAREFDKPLVVLEALRCDYPWASDRFHAFVMEGMEDNAAAFDKAGILYYAYVEPKKRAGKGLLAALAKEACVVVSDDFPAFFLPRMLAAAGKQLKLRLEAVDSNGLLPLQAAPQAFTTAFSFRAWLQKNLYHHLEQFPRPNPLARHGLEERKALPAGIRKKWPAAKSLKKLPIDHEVEPTVLRGGYGAARRRLDRFLKQGLARYAEDRNVPDREGASGLSPYLHFGHLSPHEVFSRLTEQELWKPERARASAGGKRSGWWKLSESAEGFLDQLITWRELGLNFCAQRSDYDRFESLPPFALQTLEKHARDERKHLYTLEQFECAETHDELWNAAQVQLLEEGRIHNYLRMLWGKKILEWTRSPQEALEVMIELNNKYALDGRDPNSYSGIFWVLGRYDRAWGPERPIFGKVRYMSSENTARKVSVKKYLERYAP